MVVFRKITRDFLENGLGINVGSVRFLRKIKRFFENQWDQGHFPEKHKDVPKNVQITSRSCNRQNFCSVEGFIYNCYTTRYTPPQTKHFFHIFTLLSPFLFLRDHNPSSIFFPSQEDLSSFESGKSIARKSSLRRSRSPTLKNHLVRVEVSFEIQKRLFGVFLFEGFQGF